MIKSFKKLSKEEIQKKIAHQREKQKEYQERAKQRQKQKLEELKSKPREYKKVEFKKYTKEEINEINEHKKEKAKEYRLRAIERRKEKIKNGEIKPIKKSYKRKLYKDIDYKSDYCIMREARPDDKWQWGIKRDGKRKYRHELWGGKSGKPISTREGFVVFLTLEEHTEGKFAIHKCREYLDYCRKVCEECWLEKNKDKTIDDFRELVHDNLL